MREREGEKVDINRKRQLIAYLVKDELYRKLLTTLGGSMAINDGDYFDLVDSDLNVSGQEFDELIGLGEEDTDAERDEKDEKFGEWIHSLASRVEQAIDGVVSQEVI